mmetsp:Transcript_5600/g.21071  ORF Transcript_5600/g.21071 Transcript_5600/m.21071 type:complete len:101 (-) Transcript_5600:410-712(-)|eukprot:CAMPEP_0117448184 /NCGR_PEP_ID=MMETSP0759-20121206/7269_1 /TAXON_ID=63605 /ORGANISM="Percolomonas cosmopolitus, Strain WS" /LENGTH=100 /DNA_ID=CAMNT_0005240561 /DNA_START=14 /DNA_END=316 /DNA_ORIENTATION=+
MNEFFFDIFNFRYVPLLFAFLLGILVREYWSQCTNKIHSLWQRPGKTPAFLLLSTLWIVFLALMVFMWTMVESMKKHDEERRKQVEMNTGCQRDLIMSFE